MNDQDGNLRSDFVKYYHYAYDGLGMNREDSIRYAGREIEEDNKFSEMCRIRIEELDEKIRVEMMLIRAERIGRY